MPTLPGPKYEVNCYSGNTWVYHGHARNAFINNFGETIVYEHETGNKVVSNAPCVIEELNHTPTEE
jgi:hypothetical protein